jgi:hypothetical protein
MRSRERRPNRASGSNVDQMVRMRGLEPPRSYLHTDLNRAQRRHIRPPASRSSIPSGSADASDASDDMTVVKLLSRGEHCPRVRLARRRLPCSPGDAAAEPFGSWTRRPRWPGGVFPTRTCAGLCFAASRCPIRLESCDLRCGDASGDAAEPRLRRGSTRSRLERWGRSARGSRFRWCTASTR